VVGAAPASAAATVNLTVDCINDTTLTADPGDTIVITMGPTCTSTPTTSLYNGNGPYGNVPGGATASGYLMEPTSTGTAKAYGIQSNVPGALGQRDWYAHSAGSGTTVITTTLAATDGVGTELFVGAAIAEHGDGAPQHLITWAGPRTSIGTSTPIPWWVQAYGRANKDATCESGWEPSWQEWAASVTGGWVCTRSIPSLG
jgi:hypothetical protein